MKRQRPRQRPTPHTHRSFGKSQAAAARAREEKEEKDNELGQRLRDAVRKGDEAGLQRAIRDKARLDWADAVLQQPFSVSVMHERAVCAQEGWTALHYACRAGHQQAASLLISTGATVGLRDVVWSPSPHCA